MLPVICQDATVDFVPLVLQVFEGGVAVLYGQLPVEKEDSTRTSNVSTEMTVPGISAQS
jgi:hypothetical protein